MENKIKDLESTSIERISANLKRHSAETDDLGLYDGLMSDVISYFILFRITGITKYQSLAKKFLLKVQELIVDVNELGFAKGLAGIGWGVEWIHQHHLIKVNTDVILEDIDDLLYQSVIYSKDDNVSLAEGSIGRAMYFLYRLNSKNIKPSRYRMICNLECLILLSDEISEKILSSVSEAENQISNITDFTLLDLAESLHLMLLINDKKINTQIILLTIKSIIDICEKIILGHNNELLITSKSHGFLYLSHVYLKATKFFNKKLLTSRSTLVQDSLLNKKSNTKICIEEIACKRLYVSNKNFSSHLLATLNDLNSMQNTDYGYEAFLLK